jgi:transcription initiation factor IIE alpha subunit
MQTRSTIIQCNCGVSYERAEQLLPVKDIGVFDCEMCGERLEMWSGRSVPLFKRVESGTSQRRSA